MQPTNRLSNDIQTFISHKSVGTLLKRFLDNLTASELAHVLKDVFQKSAHRLVTDKSLGSIHSVAGSVDKQGIAMQNSM